MSADLLSAAHLGAPIFVGVCNNNGRLQLSAPKGLRWFVGGPVDDMPDLDTWPLDAPVERAGGVGRSERLQRAMTAQVEQHVRDLLHDDIMALPVDDPRREAWLAVDRLSSQWVSSWPALDTPLQPALGDAEFGEVVTTRRLHGARRARGTPLCPGHILLFGHVNILFLSLLSKSLPIKGRETRPGRESGLRDRSRTHVLCQCQHQGELPWTLKTAGACSL